MWPRGRPWLWTTGTGVSPTGETCVPRRLRDPGRNRGGRLRHRDGSGHRRGTFKPDPPAGDHHTPCETPPGACGCREPGHVMRQRVLVWAAAEPASSEHVDGRPSTRAAPALHPASLTGCRAKPNPPGSGRAASIRSAWSARARGGRSLRCSPSARLSYSAVGCARRATRRLRRGLQRSPTEWCTGFYACRLLRRLRRPARGRRTGRLTP